MHKPPFKIVNQVNSSCCEIYLYGQIGRWMDIDTTYLIRDFENYRKQGCTNFTIYVNSEGGDVFQIQALWNYLNRSDIEVTWIVDGIAASSAYDMMTNPKHKILMCKYSKVMLHKVSGFVYGNAEEVRDYADRMDLFENDIIDMIATRTGQSIDQVKALYFDGKEHWLGVQDAIDAKLCDGSADGNENMSEPPASLTTSTDLYNFFQNQILNLKKNNEMDHKLIAPMLGLEGNVDEPAVISSIKNVVSRAARLEAENKDLTTKVDTLTNEVNAAKAIKVKALIDNAIQNKKFGEDLREAYTEMANENYDRTEKVINNLSGVGRVANQLQGSAGSVPEAEKDWTWNDYHKKGRLDNLKATNPERFKELFKNEFKRDYKED